jgi:hypothetical protein
MLLDDAFLYEIRGYMSSQKRPRFIPAVSGQFSGAAGSDHKQIPAEPTPESDSPM